MHNIVIRYHHLTRTGELNTSVGNLYQDLETQKDHTTRLRDSLRTNTELLQASIQQVCMYLQKTLIH